MIRSLLILWSLDPSGVGTVVVQDMPSLTACYQTVGRSRFPTYHVTCQPATAVDEVAATLAALRCTADPQGLSYTCRGRK